MTKIPLNTILNKLGLDKLWDANDKEVANIKKQLTKLYIEAKLKEEKDDSSSF